LFHSCPSENNGTIQFGYDEALDLSNELINPSDSFIENDERTSNELQYLLSMKQEAVEKFVFNLSSKKLINK